MSELRLFTDDEVRDIVRACSAQELETVHGKEGTTEDELRSALSELGVPIEKVDVAISNRGHVYRSLSHSSFNGIDDSYEVLHKLEFSLDPSSLHQFAEALRLPSVWQTEVDTATSTIVSKAMLPNSNARLAIYPAEDGTAIKITINLGRLFLAYVSAIILAPVWLAMSFLLFYPQQQMLGPIVVAVVATGMTVVLIRHLVRAVAKRESKKALDIVEQVAETIRNAALQNSDV